MTIVMIGDRRRSVETRENKGPANRTPAFGGNDASGLVPISGSRLSARIGAERIDPAR